MAYYVYQYLHPEYGHLYCGRSDNLDRRIYEHNNLLTDNIPREYENLLKESVIMYIELQNKAQGIAVEASCIDKFKPFINKALKYDIADESMLEMKLPKWKIYNEKNSKCKQHLHNIEEENKKLIDTISKVENEISQKSQYLNNSRTRLRKINYELKTCEEIESKNILFGFGLKDIEWFYNNCQNKNVKFYSEVYDKVGNVAASGIISYDSQNKLLILEKDKTQINSKDIFFETICCSLYNFYPDVNIYPELYAALLSIYEDLKIKNKTYDIDFLSQKYKDSCFSSEDDTIRVILKNNKIYSCNIRDHSLDNGFYNWEAEYGEEFVENHCIQYKKVNLNKKMRDRIYSSKYYTPEANLDEEKYCKKMLLKYSA